MIDLGNLRGWYQFIYIGTGAIALFVSIGLVQLCWKIIPKFIRRKKNGKEQEIKKEETEKEPRLNPKEAARQVSRYAEDFRDNFRNIKYIGKLPNEINDEYLYARRLNNAQESINQLNNVFETYKFEFTWKLTDREKLEESINELLIVFNAYSSTFQNWEDLARQQGRMGGPDSLKDYRDDLFGSSAEKQMKRVGVIVKRINRLLSPYIHSHISIVSYEDFHRHDKEKPKGVE